jgi:hypothetical protein
MSLTALVWALLAVGQFAMCFSRPVWAIGLYMQTFFAAPHLWWWGDEIPSARYSLWSGVVLLVAALVHRSEVSDEDRKRRKLVNFAALGMLVNASFVHYVLASRPDISIDNYVEFLKFVLLFFLMRSVIHERKDFRLALISIAVGAAYIGWEVTINERGDFSGSRLEGVGAPGAETANGLAQLMLVTLPLVGSLILNRSVIAKAAALGASPLVLNVLLLCNSRGAFLGLAGAAGSFLMVARGGTRKKAFQTLALGSVTLFLLLGDPKILDRFSTTFVGSEARDRSAASRLDFWKAGLIMLSDYPLGEGGNAFKLVHGSKYLGEATGAANPDSRSLHNGYLTEATDWGIQGLILKLLFMGGALLVTYRALERARLDGRAEDSLIGICVFVAGAGGMIHCMFGSFLANEYMYWLAAILVRYSELYGKAESIPATTTSVPVAA